MKSAPDKPPTWKLAEPKTYREYFPARDITHTNVVLAETWRDFPAGYVIGRIQQRHWPGKHPRSDAMTSYGEYCVRGVDPEWCFRQFMEYKGGVREARHAAIKAGARYDVTRTFGMLKCEPGLYEPGMVLQVTGGGPTHVSVTVHYRATPNSPDHCEWDREAFESCVDTFCLVPARPE